MAYIPVFLVRDGGVKVIDKDASAPGKVAEIVRAFIGADSTKEHVVVLMLNVRNKVLGINLVSVGTLTASLIHPREVFQPAILAGAAGIIVAHNHPSGDCGASPEDRTVTQRLVKAGELLGIPCIDHVIITNKAFYSFKEQGEIT